MTSAVPPTDTTTVQGPENLIRYSRAEQAALLSQGKIDEVRVGEMADIFEGPSQERHEFDRMYR